MGLRGRLLGARDASCPAHTYGIIAHNDMLGKLSIKKSSYSTRNRTPDSYKIKKSYSTRIR